MVDYSKYTPQLLIPGGTEQGELIYREIDPLNDDGTISERETIINPRDVVPFGTTVTIETVIFHRRKKIDAIRASNRAFYEELVNLFNLRNVHYLLMDFFGWEVSGVYDDYRGPRKITKYASSFSADIQGLLRK